MEKTEKTKGKLVLITYLFFSRKLKKRHFLMRKVVLLGKVILQLNLTRKRNKQLLSVYATSLKNQDRNSSMYYYSLKRKNLKRKNLNLKNHSNEKLQQLPEVYYYSVGVIMGYRKQKI